MSIKEADAAIEDTCDETKAGVSIDEAKAEVSIDEDKAEKTPNNAPKQPETPDYAARQSYDETCHFLRLPPEIRIMILEYAMDTTAIVAVSHLIRGNRARLQEPRIVATCRTIRREAQMVYYGNSTFATRHRKDLKIFLEHIGHERRKLLREVFPLGFMWPWNIERTKTALEQVETEFGLRKGTAKAYLVEDQPGAPHVEVSLLDIDTYEEVRGCTELVRRKSGGALEKEV